MATQMRARNRTKRRFEKILEQTSNLCREFSANVFAPQMVTKGRDFFELFLSSACRIFGPDTRAATKMVWNFL